MMVVGSERRTQVEEPFVFACCWVMLVTSATNSTIDRKQSGIGVAANMHSESRSKTSAPRAEVDPTVCSPFAVVSDRVARRRLRMREVT